MSKEILAQYRELVKTQKVIGCVFLTVKKDKEGVLCADLNSGWIIGLLNCDEGLLETYVAENYQVVEDFGIKKEGQYEIEAVFDFNPEQRSFAAPVQPDFKAYYELNYFEVIGEYPLDNEPEVTEGHYFEY